MPRRLLMIPAISASLLVVLSASAFAQRPYQRYWKEQLQKQKEPVIVEDQLKPLEVEQEHFLYGDDVNAMVPSTVFPGERLDDQDPVSRLALREYIRGAINWEMGSPAQAVKAFGQAAEKDPENIWMKLRLAESAAMMNDLSRAEGLLNDVLKVDPTNFRAMLRMADVAIVRQKYEEARKWYEKVVEVKPGNIQALQALTQLAYEIDRDLEKTRELSHRILLIDDKNWEAMLWNAEANALTGNPAIAADLYERLIRYRPALLERMAEVARRLSASGKADDARQLYERAMLIAPEQQAIRRAWEATLLEIGGEAAVRNAYQRIVEESNQDLKVYDLYADYLRRATDWDALVALREEVLRKDPDHINSLLDIAYFHLRGENFDKALPYFERALSVGEGDPDVYRQVGQAYLQNKDLAKAKELYEKALAMNPADILSLDALASIAALEGRTADAEKLIRQALDQSPANAFLLRKLGALYLHGGERQKARELYQQVITADPADLDTWIDLARLYLQDGDENSLKLLEGQAADKLGNVSRFHAMYGVLTQQFGEFERSRKALERALRQAPEDFEVRAALARTYLQLNLPEQALKVVREAEPIVKSNEPLLRRQQDFLVSLLMELGRYEEAEKLLKARVEEKPTDLARRQAYLTALVKGGKEDAATEELNAIVREFGTAEPVETQRLRASTLLARGDAPRAVSILRKLVEENPTNHDLRLDLAIAASEADDLELAEKNYRALIDLGPAESNEYFEVSSNNLGYMLARRGERLDEAEKLVKQALAVNPDAAYILDSVGWVYFQKGNYEEARKYLERAARLSFRDHEVYTNLGQLYEKLGEKEKAQQMYEKALALDPQLKLAKERRDALALPEKKDPNLQ